VENKNLSLIGKLLFFSPSDRGPSYFTNSLIFICDHSSEGTVGLIINRQIDLMTNNLLKGVGLETKDLISPKNLLIGGPVNPGSVFILHSNNKTWDSTLKVTEEISLSTSKDTLEDIAKNDTPKDYLITLGYAGWTEGQLEQELSENAWITAPGDFNIIFRTEPKDQIIAVSKLLGFDVTMVSPEFGNA
jgi:putative transcriptional regulator